uniref:Uncharacterized protein n=1 Tax=Alexandrium monilatum TaxID=311494 RepID=A0A7S4SMF0_9DINO|mmetsp:Transcript_17879/g.53907  ORF Transcript_17879/g.53907 Transcript_17879/m.53907 type:complete len:193 (+) Transcript_17879:33-611(+)
MGCTHGGAHGGAASPGAGSSSGPQTSSWAQKAAASQGDDAGLRLPELPVIQAREPQERRQEQRGPQRQEQRMVKDFVTGMVRGRKIDVVLQSGRRKTCACSLSRALDALKVKVGEEERRIPLADVSGLHAGAESKPVDAPLDELCATMVLMSEEAISFRFPGTEERDTFVTCLSLFIERQQQNGGREHRTRP